MQTMTPSVLLLFVTAQATLTSNHHIGDPSSREQDWRKHAIRKPLPK